MPKFGKYHPILTPHYTFDWLTQARAKDVLAFYQTRTSASDPVPTILSVADQINATMRAIAHDQKLVWGISQRNNDQFIGQASFDPIDQAQQTATLTVQVLPVAHTASALAELYDRLTAFGTQELELTTLTVTLPQADPVVEQVLTGLHFQVSTLNPHHYQLP